MTAGSGARPLLLRCRTLLAHADAVPLEDAGVLVADGTVVRVAPFADLAGDVPADRTVTLDGTVLPAFTDAHSHLRGLPLAEQGVADACLEVWVVRLTGTTALDPHDDALVAAADLAATGVTTVQAIHHTFAPPDEYAAGVHAVVSALEKAGLRAELALGLTDQSEFLPERAPAVWPGAERLAAPERGWPPPASPACSPRRPPVCTATGGYGSASRRSRPNGARTRRSPRCAAASRAASVSTPTCWKAAASAPGRRKVTR